MSVNDPHMVFNNLITRFLSDELSADELSLFRSALSQEPDLKLQLEEYRKIWDSVDGVAAHQRYDMDAEWSALHKIIPDFDSTEERFVKTRKGGRGKGRSMLYFVYRIAAVLVTGVLLTFAWIYATQIAGTRVEVARAEPLEILLGDGTKVVLNRESKIRYRKQFRAGVREISLTGEAWFDVARDTTRPFVIDAGPAMVEVLGTSFNVSAYKENSTVEITVESGVVAVTAKEDQKEQIILRAGNSGSYNSVSRELLLVPSFNPNNLSWKTRELYFEDTPLGEVAGLIEKVYNVRVVIPNPELASCPITVTFSDQSLESVLKVLEATLDLEVSRTGKTIMLNGSGCIE